MGCLAWNETASAVLLGAEHAEEVVAPGGTAARFVEYAVFSCPERVLYDRSSTFCGHVFWLTGQALQPLQLPKFQASPGPHVRSYPLRANHAIVCREEAKELSRVGTCLCFTELAAGG